MLRVECFFFVVLYSYVSTVKLEKKKKQTSTAKKKTNNKDLKKKKKKSHTQKTEK